MQVLLETNQVGLVEQPPLAGLTVALKTQLQRQSVEQFIAQGFHKAYGASINHFLTLLVHFGQMEQGAALGLSSANTPLFIEQYLPRPIEQYLPEVVGRAQIAELGNLYSNARHVTVPLFMISAVSLHRRGFRYLSFCGTAQVRAILAKYAVPFTVIAHAHSMALGEQAALWGTYYQNQPQICVLDLNDVMHLIETHPFHLKIMTKLANEITQLCQELVNL